MLTSGRGLAIVCSVPGDVKVQFPDDSQLVVPATTGYSQFPFAVKKLLATGTTATATYALLN